jgi:hypothetical protein
MPLKSDFRKEMSFGIYLYILDMKMYINRITSIIDKVIIIFEIIAVLTNNKDK